MTHRRDFLLNSLRIAAGVSLASACGPATPAQPARPPTSAAPPPAQPTAAPTSAPATATNAATVAPANVKRGGEIVVGDISGPTSLDPAFITNRVCAHSQRPIYDPLVDLDENATLLPGLAESWELGPDAKSVTLHLRRGVKFHDGTAFDAEAVKVHFDRHLDPATKSLRTGELVGIDRVDVLDPSTVRISLKTPNPQILYLLIDWDAFIESPTALQKYGADFAQHPVGTGPFRVVDYVEGDHINYERNPDYWEPGKPSIDTLRIRSIPTDETRLVELQSGGVHIVIDPPYQDIDRIRAMNGVKLTTKLGGRFSYWTWNTSLSPYGKSQAFRQALNWAADREGILRAVLFNSGRTSFAPFHAGTPFDDPNYQPFTRNLDKAKALLDQSGVPQPANFTVYVGPTGYYSKLAQLIAANYADVGVNMEIQNMADAAITALERQQGNFHLSVYNGGWSWRADPSLYLRNILHSQSTYTKWIYNDPQMDTLIEQGEAETDLDKRKAIYHSLADQANQDSALIFAYQEQTFVALSPSVGGWVQRADVKPRFQDFWLQGNP
jgi:peptide/nickel transport system substrate-binding protein